MARNYSPQQTPASSQEPQKTALGTPVMTPDRIPPQQQYNDGRRFSNTGFMGDQPCRKCGGSGMKAQRGIVSSLIRGVAASGEMGNTPRYNNTTYEAQTAGPYAPVMTANGRPVYQQQYDNERSFYNTGFMGDQPCRKCGGTGVKRQRGIIRPLIRGAVASGGQEMSNRFNMR